MKKIFVTLLVRFAMCSLAAAEDKLISVSLERTACFGSCPSYVVTILADGSVTFEGREFVKAKGLSKKKIDLTKLEPLLKKIAEIHFWDLEDKYRTKKLPNRIELYATDMPTQYVTVKFATRSKRVEDYYGTPTEVQELEKLIDEIAGVSEWVGRPNEKKP